MRKLLVFSAALAAAGGAAPAAAQPEVQTDVHVQSLADPAYAARLLVETLAESIRTGQPDPRVSPDPELHAAAAALARARAGGPPPPRRELGRAWDFRLDVTSVEAQGPDRLVVHGDAYLATDPGPARPPVRLVVQRNDHGQWQIADASGFLPRLDAIVRRASARRGQ